MHAVATSIAPITPSRPLCVDLDGTLVRSDLLIESALALMKRAPLTLLLFPFWLLRGKAYLKEQIAHRVSLDATNLPYHELLLARLRDEKANGRILILATASHQTLAEPVAQHLGIFDAVHATSGRINLSADAKRDCLVAHYGRRGFDYAGNGPADLSIWSEAREAWLVDVDPAAGRRARQAGNVTLEFDHGRRPITAMIKELRLHQWLKNLLIFVPLAAAHQVGNVAAFVPSIFAFLAFGACASSVYLLNDLLDLNADRQHPRKRKRPFASGALPLLHGILLIPVLLASTLAFSLLLLPSLFVVVLAGYFAITLVYSLWAKQQPIVDILFLAVLYTMRLLAGAAAAHIALSFWLLAFSTFLFLSLALVKRYTEMHAMRKAGRDAASGRGYTTDDLPLIASMGTAAGYVAVLVLALYINSSAVDGMYREPRALWGLCLILLFWISRIWLLTHRGRMPDDPVVFAAKDKVSWGLAVLALLTVVAATFGIK
jgi:4-hydroxybenzoate polyprenyltransferase/phosphoserine phosphatase